MLIIFVAFIHVPHSLKYDDLIRALDCIQKKDVDFVYPVTEFQHPIQSYANG